MPPTAFISPLKTHVTSFRRRRAWVRCINLNEHNLKECVFPVNQFQSYVIYYRERPEGIEIIRVLHAHMDKKNRFNPKERSTQTQKGSK
jgi:hypothetical protein